MNKHFCGIKLCKVLYFIRVYVKMLFHTVVTWLNNLTVHSALFFMKASFPSFLFLLVHNYINPIINLYYLTQSKLCLHSGVDVIPTCTLSVFQNLNYWKHEWITWLCICIRILIYFFCFSIQWPWDSVVFLNRNNFVSGTAIF